MFRIINAWNIASENNSKELTKDIGLRGYDKETFLTGEFARKVAHEDIRPLSVSNISHRYCPSRRDLYFYKGIARPSAEDLDSQEMWGGKAGYVVEQYIECILGSENGNIAYKYSSLIEKGDELHCSFVSHNNGSIERLKCFENTQLAEIGDTDWLLRLLCNNGRAELGMRVLHSSLKENGSLDVTHIKLKENIKPCKSEIGITSPATPDFIAPEFSLVGDIKTGVEFESYYQLTCVGYALAYENWKKENINWGMIYLFPTRIPSAYVKPITFTQIYIFLLDDSLRQWFLDVRDEDYSIISKANPPNFPDKSRRKNCQFCRFNHYCVSQGLELTTNG